MVDITQRFHQLRKAGNYQIHWSSGQLLSNRIAVKIIPPYDPSKTYEAEIVTDTGSIAISFFSQQSPIAVKAFVDMAHSGLYRGNPIHEIHEDWYIVAGRMENPGWKTFVFPAESSNLPLVAGTVVLRPSSAAPPSNSSEFIILLKPEPSWTGHVTVLGQVIKGLDVVQKISAGVRATKTVPSSP